MPYSLASTQNAPNIVHNTIAAPATTEVAVVGFAGFDPTSTTAGEFMDLFRSTGGATPTAQTPEKLNASEAASSVTANRGSSTDPTKSGNSLVVLGYAHIITTLAILPRHWRVPDPRQPVVVPVSGQLSLQIDAGGNVCDRYLIFAQPSLGRFAARTRGRRGRTRGDWHLRDHATGLNGLATRPVAPQFAGEFRLPVPSDWDTPPVVSPVWLLGGDGALFTLDVAGALTDAGALTLQGDKALAGALTGAGALAKLALKPLAGTLTDAGTLAKRANKPLAGGVAPTGALANSKLASVALAGALATAGALVVRASKALAGALTSAGALTRRANKALAGGLTGAGTLAKQAAKPLAGGLATAGTLARRANRTLAGALAPTGALAVVSQAGAAAVALGRVFALGARQLTMRAAGRLTTVGVQPRALAMALRARATTLAARARQLLYGMRGR